MGKKIRVQRRGRGSSTYRSKAFRSRGEIRLPPTPKENVRARVVDILHDPGRGAPVARIRYPDGQERLVLAPEGVRVGSKLTCGVSAPIKSGNALTLAEIPEGTPIYNIETRPGAGGQFVRASGTHAVLLAHDVGQAIVRLPSGEIRSFSPRCCATVGVVAGGGRVDKPFVKAGKRYHEMRAKGKLYPRVCGVAMNVVDHPFGSGRGRHAGRPRTVSRHAPPGQKVGLIASKRTGER